MKPSGKIGGAEPANAALAGTYDSTIGIGTITLHADGTCEVSITGGDKSTGCSYTYANQQVSMVVKSARQPNNNKADILRIATGMDGEHCLDTTYGRFCKS